MRRLDERQQVKDAIELFRRHYGEGSYLSDKRGIMVGAELAKLDPETATARDILELIGNNSWIDHQACGECGKRTWDIIEIGEAPDHESRTAYVCATCLAEGVRVALGIIEK